jgi:hypothetical protein
MKNLVKIFFMVMVMLVSVNASEIDSSDCPQLLEPCEPLDLWAEPCDPIAD